MRLEDAFILLVVAGWIATAWKGMEPQSDPVPPTICVWKSVREQPHCVEGNDSGDDDDDAITMRKTK